MVSWPSYITWNKISWLTKENSREEARIWIEKNIPEKSRIIIEANSPFIDPNRFQAQGIASIAREKPEWYYEQKIEYVITSKLAHGRYFADSDRYTKEQIACRSLNIV